MKSKKQNPPGATGGLGVSRDRLAALHSPENNASRLILQAKNVAATVASIDPATIAGLAFLLIGGRQ
jgi:hypothetical protein